MNYNIIKKTLLKKKKKKKRKYYHQGKEDVDDAYKCLQRRHVIFDLLKEKKSFEDVFFRKDQIFQDVF